MEPRCPGCEGWTTCPLPRRGPSLQRLRLTVLPKLLVLPPRSPCPSLEPTGTLGTPSLPHTHKDFEFYKLSYEADVGDTEAC